MERSFSTRNHHDIQDLKAQIALSQARRVSCQESCHEMTSDIRHSSALLDFVFLSRSFRQQDCCLRALVGSVVAIEGFFITLLPCCFQVRMCDIPIGPALSENRTQILAKVFDCRPTKEPVAVVDFVNDKPGLKHDGVWNHRIVQGVRVFGNIEVFLKYTPGIGQERPVGTNSAAKFIRLNDTVGSDCD